MLADCVGGFGLYVTETCMKHGLTVPRACFGVEDRYLPHGSHERLLEEAGLSARQLAQAIEASLKGGRGHG